jgi:hypothetical protein
MNHDDELTVMTTENPWNQTKQTLETAYRIYTAAASCLLQLCHAPAQIEHYWRYIIASSDQPPSEFPAVFQL